MSDYRIEAATKEEWAARALKAEDARDKAIHQLSEISRALGEAEGKLAASEMAGIVEGWKARAEKAEAEAKRLRKALKLIAHGLYDGQEVTFHSARGCREIARAALNRASDDGVRDRAREEGEK